MEKYIIAIDLGGTSIQCAFITASGEIVDTWSMPTPIQEEGQMIVPTIIDSIQEQLKQRDIQTNQLLGIGMGSPGKVDCQAQTVEGAYNLNWKTPQYVGEAFRSEFEVPFLIDNDANVAALGEQAFGAGEGFDDIVFITLGTGVGGGVIVDRQLIHGAGYVAGEIGHVTIDTSDDALLCTCGKLGCLETVASATGVVNLARRQLCTNSGVSGKIPSIYQADFTAKDVFDFAREGDRWSLSIVDEFAYYLGLACGNIANLLNPGKIIFGGGLSQAGPFLLEQVNRHYESFLFPKVRESSHLSLATLGNRAGILGAAQLVIAANKEN